MPSELLGSCKDLTACEQLNKKPFFLEQVEYHIESEL